MDRRKGQKQSAGRHGDEFWAEEKSNFGLKMMSKMGWEKGKGLGKKEAGITSFVRAKKKDDTLGIGATNDGRDAHWLATQGLYNDLLKRLAESAATGDIAAEQPAEVKEEKVNNARALSDYVSKRNLYGRFKRAKDVSQYSATNVSEILGRKASTPEPQPDPTATASKLKDETIVTVTSNVSIKDYFARKLADNSKKVSRFNAAGGNGFSEDQQADYYEQMMGISHKGRGGLGFGPSASPAGCGL